MKHCSNDSCPDLLRNGFRSEYLDPLEICPECDQRLTGGPAPPPPSAPTRTTEWVDQVCVATFSDFPSAQVARIRLESAGIPAVVENEHMQSVYPQAIRARLCVPGEHAEEAARILARDDAELVEDIAEDDLSSIDEETTSVAIEDSPPLLATPDQTAETLAILLIACGYPLVSILVYPRQEYPPSVEDLGIGCIWDLGWVLLIGCLLTRDTTFRWNLPATRPQWFAELGWGVVLFFVCTGADRLFGDVARSLGLESSPTPWLQWLSDPDVLLAFRMAGPLSALYQELLFRVYLQNRLTPIARGWSLVSVPATAWLFAQTHDYAPAQTAELFGWALVLGTAYQVSRRVPRLVIAHSLALVFYPV